MGTSLSRHVAGVCEGVCEQPVRVHRSDLLNGIVNISGQDGNTQTGMCLTVSMSVFRG